LRKVFNKMRKPKKIWKEDYSSYLVLTKINKMVNRNNQQFLIQINQQLVKNCKKKMKKSKQTQQIIRIKTQTIIKLINQFSVIQTQAI